MNIYDSVDLDTDRVSGKVGRKNNGRVYRKASNEVGSGDVWEVELYIGYDEFCFEYGSNFNKCVRGGVSVGVGGSIGWGVDICVGFVFGGADGIIFGIDDWYDMSYSHLYFYV